MIIRIWHGYTNPDNADAYQHLLTSKILPGIHRVKGYQGAYLMRKQVGGEVEFTTLTLWDSMDSVREFAGDDQAHAVVPEEARKLLARFDQRSEHFDAIWCP
jgi:heme-degrading monooxygenase HmoA